MAILDGKEKDSFMAGLKTGLGLTLAARLIGRSAKEVSEVLRENRDLYLEASKAMTEGAKIIMVQGSEYLRDKKLKKFKDNNLYIKEFLDQLVLWECLCKREEVTPKKVIQAFTVYKERPEVATSIGMEESELMAYLIEKPEINQYLKYHQII